MIKLPSMPKKLYGFDVDGVLIPLARRVDNLGTMRKQLKWLQSQGHTVVCLTSATDPAQRARALQREYGIVCPVHGMSRDRPADKGQWLVDNAIAGERPILIDDEEWYLNPAAKLGVMTMIVRNGVTFAYTPPTTYVPWVPKATK